MFTPPPSPFPSKPSPMTEVPCTHTTPSASPRRKHIFTLRWILVPIILVAIAVTTRFVAHPMVFDAFSPTSNIGYNLWLKRLTDWSLHERHKTIKSPLQPVVPSGTVSLPLVKRSNPTTAPTIPTSPTLPTPFPQPYDTTLSSNFSTTSCYNFFLNMTQTDALRSCRPFSLLLTHSQAFIKVCFILDDVSRCSTSRTGPKRYRCHKYRYLGDMQH